MIRWWTRFLPYARPYVGQFAVVLLLMTLVVGLNTIAPWPLKLIVDFVVTDEPLPRYASWLSGLPGGNSTIGLLAWLASSTLLIFMSRHTIGALRAYIQAGAAARMKYDLSADLFDHLQRLSMIFHSRSKTGDLVRRVTSDTGCIQQLLVGVIYPAIMATLTLLLMLVVMWQMNHTLAVMSLIAAIPMPFLMRWLGPRMEERSYEQHQAEGELLAVVEQTMSAIPAVQAFGRETHGDSQFYGISLRAMRAYLKTIISQLQYKIGVGSATALGTALVMMFGGFHVLNNSLTVGSLLVFLSYLGTLYGQMESIAHLSSSNADATARARRIMEVLDSDQMVQEPANPVPFPKITTGGAEIEFEQVTFGYENDRPVLSDISLKIARGESVGIVGTTGVGKSTLVALIPRLFDPWRGRITINGVDIRDFRLEGLRSNIGIVSQDTVLFPGSILENIRYGNPEASHQEMMLAAEAAQVEEFVYRMPQGYDTVIGERGATLSGGQRQRISIARAILRNAPILILDEPTSSLDSKTEHVILEAIEQLMKDRTTVIVSHRFSILHVVDNVRLLNEFGIAVESKDQSIGAWTG